MSKDNPMRRSLLFLFLLVAGNLEAAPARQIDRKNKTQLAIIAYMLSCGGALSNLVKYLTLGAGIYFWSNYDSQDSDFLGFFAAVAFGVSAGSFGIERLCYFALNKTIDGYLAKNADACDWTLKPL